MGQQNSQLLYNIADYKWIYLCAFQSILTASVQVHVNANEGIKEHRWQMKSFTFLKIRQKNC